MFIAMTRAIFVALSPERLQHFHGSELCKQSSDATSLLSDSGKQRSVSSIRNKERAPENVMQKYDTPAPIAAVLDIPAGRVQFIAADRADTTVEVRPADPAKSRDAKSAERTTVTYADGVLRITAATPDRQLLGPSGSVEVTVQLPAGSRVEVTAAGVELRGVGRLGDVAVDGAYHQIKIDEADGVRLTAVDGDVEVGRLGGPAEISTERGDIRIGEAVRGTVVLRTRSGDISVAATAGVSAVLDAGTDHGRVSNALKNDGTAELDIRATTAKGDITARSL
jgi:Putative adhesin